MIRDFYKFLSEEKNVPDPGKAANWIWDHVQKKKKEVTPNQPKQKPLEDENDDFLP